MKVSFCAPWDRERDGVADYSKEFVDALRRNGAGVDIIKLEPYIGDRAHYRSLAEKANAGDLVHVQFNYSYFNGELPYRNRFVYFARLLKRPLVMTAHEVRIGYEPVHAGIDNTAKRMIFNNTILFWDMWSKMYHRKMYDSASKIIVHTDGQAKKVSSLIHCQDKVVVIPHGIPKAPAKDMALDSASAKSAMGLSGKTVVTIPGFINRRKGYETAIDAIAGLPDDAVLLIAGGKMTENAVDRGYYNSLMRAIFEKGLSGRVVVTGCFKEEDLPRIMASTDICLAPFSSDAASGALGRCIAYNKPIVASDTPVNREINERVPCLELFRSGDPRDLSEKIRGLLADKEKAAGLVELTKRYSERYGFDSMAGETLKVYEAALHYTGRR
jgi:glycosyltransferase involved in cell wall biosynthesis